MCKKKNEFIEKQISLLMKETLIEREECIKLIKCFLEQSFNLVSKIKNDINKNNFEAISESLHTLKGASANIRAKKMYNNIVEANKAAKERDVSKIKYFLNNIERQAKNLQNSLQYKN